MSKPATYQSPYDRLSAIYEAICEAAMCNPWEREPFAVIRREKRSDGITNLVPNYQAHKLARWLDGCMDDLAVKTAERVGMRIKIDFLPSGYKRLTVVYQVVEGNDMRWLNRQMVFLTEQAEIESDTIYGG